MTDWAQVAALALIQGMTEFLPVSSSAHLILPSQILGWSDQGLLFDVSVHAGTLCAVLWYFRATFGKFLTSVMPGSAANRSELWSLCIATIPVVIVGVVLKDLIATEARAVAVITVTTLGFGVLMGVADRASKRGCHEAGAGVLWPCTIDRPRAGLRLDSGDVPLGCHDHSSAISGLPSCRRHAILLFTERSGNWWRTSGDAGDGKWWRNVTGSGGNAARFCAVRGVCLRHDQSVYVLVRQSGADAFRGLPSAVGIAVVGLDNLGIERDDTG